MTQQFPYLLPVTLPELKQLNEVICKNQSASFAPIAERIAALYAYAQVDVEAAKRREAFCTLSGGCDPDNV